MHARGGWLQMLRLYRVDRMIQALYFKYPKSVFLVTMLQLLLYMFLCAHLMSCIWYFVSYGDPHGWIENDAWLAIAEVDADGQRARNLGYAWISGLYWAIATMVVQCICLRCSACRWSRMHAV